MTHESASGRRRDANARDIRSCRRESQTMAFTTLVFAQLVNVMSTVADVSSANVAAIGVPTRPSWSHQVEEAAAGS